jgi:hypothetical protein
VLPLCQEGQVSDSRRVSGITRGLSGAILARNRLTRGLSENVPFDAPSGAAGLGNWEPGRLAAWGAVGGVPRRGPTLPRSWRGCHARGRNTAAGAPQ